MPEAKLMTGAPDRAEFNFKMAAQRLGGIGIHNAARLDPKDLKKLEELAKTKKLPVDFCASFDGVSLDFYSKVGSAKGHITSIDLAADNSILDKEKTLEGLVKLGAADKATVEKYRKANPDKKAIAALKAEITELETKIKNNQAELATKKKQYAAIGGK